MNRRCMGCMEVYDDQYNICPHCGYIYGTPAAEAYHIQPGSKLKNGRYTVGKVLGFGGFGVTYIGFDENLLVKLAIKEYLPGEFSTRMPNQQAVTVYTGEREEQFNEGKIKTLDEARRLAKFQSEPSIVHVFDFFEENNTAYIIMEFCDGKSLKEIMAENGPFSVDEALEIILQVIAGMKPVHKEGMIHRDIAPDNIYRLKDGSIKILDFGAARYATTKHSKSLSVIIKPGYAPEEQYRSRGDQGPWTDVYALAATFYKMITGVTPPDAMERGVKDMLKRPSKMGVSIPKGMETALLNALNVAIEDRTQSMDEFEQELLAADVKAKEVHDRTEDVGKLSASVKIGAAIGGMIVAALIVFALLLSPASPVREFILPEDKVWVPNFINMSAEDAVLTADAAYLKFNEGKTEYRDDIPKGLVFAQSVEPGTQVTTDKKNDNKRRVIEGQVSAGPPVTLMPYIIGMSEKNAVQLLKDSNLKPQVEMVDQPDKAPGTVSEVSETRDKKLFHDTTIIVKVVEDKGQIVRGTVKDIEVPDVTGMSIEEAERVLKEAGLLTERNNVENEAIPKDQVISQKISAGEMVVRNEVIALDVSVGRGVTMVPLLRGSTPEEAEKLLKEAGLVLDAETSEDYDASVPEGQVVRSEPGQETAVEKGTAVRLVISKGENPADKAKREREAEAARRRETTAPTQAPPPATEAAPRETQPAPPPQTEAPPPPTTAAPPPPEQDSHDQRAAEIGL